MRIIFKNIFSVILYVLDITALIIVIKYAINCNNKVNEIDMSTPNCYTITEGDSTKTICKEED